MSNSLFENFTGYSSGNAGSLHRENYSKAYQAKAVHTSSKQIGSTLKRSAIQTRGVRRETANWIMQARIRLNRTKSVLSRNDRPKQQEFTEAAQRLLQCLTRSSTQRDLLERKNYRRFVHTKDGRLRWKLQRMNGEQNSERESKQKNRTDDESRSERHRSKVCCTTVCQAKRF